MAASTLSFAIIPSEVAHFGPRLGTVSLLRRDGSSVPELKTPCLMTACSRGVVPHLSRDHVKSTMAIRWANIPFESFLERLPPVPTLQTGNLPLHTFLGFNPEQHILALSARDSSDGKEVPPNGKDFVSTYCVRGVRKLSPSAWKSYALSCQPDLVVALSDNPLIEATHSQKRLTKSLERSTSWLVDLLRPVTSSASQPGGSSDVTHPFNVLVNMIGGSEERARVSFAEALAETLYGKDQEQVHPLRNLDEGVKGYVFELLPLLRGIRAELESKNHHPHKEVPNTSNGVKEGEELVRLIKASLSSLPKTKLRILHSCPSPHQILRLIRDVGVDLFDAHWAHRAADIGIALDFRFPVPNPNTPSVPSTQTNGPIDLGHNLFDSAYANDHARLASSFVTASNVVNTSTSIEEQHVCPCLACSPLSPTSHLELSSTEDQAFVKAPRTLQPPYTRAYIHHLLHTHEMSSHSLLAMHNLSVMDAFFGSIRKVLGSPGGGAVYNEEVDRFCATYDEGMNVFRDAEGDWRTVELERGKGRLAREKEKLANGSSG